LFMLGHRGCMPVVSCPGLDEDEAQHWAWKTSDAEAVLL
jgi:hypothetical protein